MRTTLSVGDQVDRYLLEAELGAGGFGVVFRARNVTTKGAVALKVLYKRDDDSVRRFFQEAKAATATGHPNIVKVLDAGQSEDGTYFLAMEYLEGLSLRQLLRERQRLALKDALPIAMQLLSALAEVHRQGILHRDVKPENIFITRDSEGQQAVKLLDFGCSKIANESLRADQTRTGVALGTPHYSSPEQLFGSKQLDARCDIYAVSVVLFEMLSGKRPHDAPSFELLLVKVLDEDPKPLHVLEPSVSVEVSAVVARGLAREASERFEGAESMADALRTAVEPKEPLLPTGRAAPKPTEPLASTVFAATADPPLTHVFVESSSKRPSGASWTRWIGLGLAAAAALGLFVFAASLLKPLVLPAVSTSTVGGTAGGSLIDVQLRGCEVSIEGQLTSEVTITSLFVQSEAGGIYIQLGTNSHPDEISLSTDRSYFTVALVTVGSDEGLWTSRPGGLTDFPMRGTIRVLEKNLDLGIIEVELVDVVMVNEEGAICEVSGRVRAVQ